MQRQSGPQATVSVALFVCAVLASANARGQADDHEHHHDAKPDRKATALAVPAGGKIPVAIVIGQGAEVLDFTGPLEVFAQAYTEDGHPLFAPYTVAVSKDPVTVGGGLKIAPDHTFKTAPDPKIVVIPAMAEAAATPEMIEWIKNASKSTDVTMSVCNGAFILAKTGLLSGKSATAHHGGYFRFVGMYPEIRLKRGARFVEDGNIASAGGVSSGIDLALRVVERYVGRDAVTRLAEVIEYQGKGWLNPESNEAFATMPTLDGKHPLCPLCFMEGDPAIKTVHRGKTYYFCADGEKEFFEKHPDVLDRFLAEDEVRRAGSKQ